MDVISLRAAFVVMFLALHMHQVQLVNQAVALEKIDGPVDRDPVDLRIDAPRFTEDLTGIKMLFRRLHHA